MRGKIITVYPTGAVLTAILTESPETERLQKEVDGYIELVAPLDTWEGAPCVAFCNEEGKNRGLPVNKKATLAAGPIFSKYDVLVGNVVILTGDEEFMASL